MRDNGCSGCKYEHLKGSEKPCCDCANMHMDKYEPITNADRIRNMSDEELAEWINTKNICEQCTYEPESLCMKEPCTNGILKWLQSEAEQNRREYE